jgi:hypothetical protein
MKQRVFIILGLRSEVKESRGQWSVVSGQKASIDAGFSGFERRAMGEAVRSGSARQRSRFLTAESRSE